MESSFYCDAFILFYAKTEDYDKAQKTFCE